MLSESNTADVVVVGGGTIGGWCATFLAEGGAGKVVLLDKSLLGRGASSRAAGMTRAQGGSPAAVKLGMWSIDFYRRQHDLYGIDSGFVQQGYFMPAFNETEVADAKERVAMQRPLGLEVEWLDPGPAAKLNPTMAQGCCLGGTYAPGDGYIDPPRNVLAYAAALQRAGVEIRERVEFLGLRMPAGRVTGVETSEGVIETAKVVLTGGPELASVGNLAGVRVPAGGVRHQVAVTEPCPQLSPKDHPMVFDLGAGIYWRPEDEGLLFGMSNPDESPGPAKGVDWPYLEIIRDRMAKLVPGTSELALRRVWAATIDYTPDHLPIVGPAITRDEKSAATNTIEGTIVASAGGHGMMWGPGVARAAADLCLKGSTDVFAVSDFGLDRFDSEGRSRLAPDPIALPFPERTLLK